MLWTTRSAPSLSGCCRYGEAKVLSTASSAPCLWASSAMAAMSRICRSGLVGVSIQTSFVFGVMIACEAGRRRVVGVAGGEAPRLEDLVEQAEGAAVQVGRGGDLVAGLQQRAEHRRRRRQAGGERQAALAAFQRREARFEGRARRVAAAGVLVALVLAGRGLGVGGGGVDRHDGRAGGRVGVLAGVDGPGGEAVLVGSVIMRSP